MNLLPKNLHSKMYGNIRKVLEHYDEGMYEEKPTEFVLELCNVYSNFNDTNIFTYVKGNEMQNSMTEYAIDDILNCVFNKEQVYLNKYLPYIADHTKTISYTKRNRYTKCKYMNENTKLNIEMAEDVLAIIEYSGIEQAIIAAVILALHNTDY